MFFRYLTTGDPFFPRLLLNKDEGGGGSGASGDTGTGEGGTGGTGEGGTGSGNTDPTGGTGDGGTGGGESGSGTDKTYTEADLDKRLKKNTNWAEKQGRTKLLEELGIDDPEALKAIVEADTKRKEDELSDQQKATAAAEKATADAVKAQAAATEEKVKAQLERALLRPGDDAEAEPGLNPERIDGAMAIALPHALASDDPDSAIADAVAHTRATVPEVFGSPAGGGKTTSTGTTGTPGRTNGQRSSNKSGPKTEGGEAILEWQKGQGRLAPLPGQEAPT